MPEGIYYNKMQFFRFYKDGTFLDCLIKGEGDIKLISNWFNKENSSQIGIINGHYTVVNNTITFSTTGHFGDGRMIDYKGKINGTKEIIFDSLNHNNGRKTKNEKFIKL